MPADLPVLALGSAILASLRSVPRLLLCAPTGSGKSTQVPQMLLRAGLLERGQAVVLQPRRLPARALAARVARELGTPLGQDVGYQVRFENRSTPDTRIRYVTEGLLLRQFVADPDLPGVAALVFDEFHERHLEADLALPLALALQQRRPGLLVLVMSATLDGDRLESFLAPCSRIESEGRVFPVEIAYSPGDGPVWDRAADAVSAWARSGGEGDALVFMPGAFEIHRTLEALPLRPSLRGRRFLPLHGDLPSDRQDEALEPGGAPRIVVATNVAETSLTIEGVRLVVDSGLARIPRHDPLHGVNSLRTEEISRASADQRAGRAGRTAPGRCIRLWSEMDHARRPSAETPEVRRVELSEAVLVLKAAGVADPRAFRWLDAPEPKALARAEELLADLGATDAAGALTPLGRRMLAFPAHPRTARMLLAAGELGCVREACLAAALTQGRDLLVRGADPLAAERRDDLIGDRDTSDFRRLMRAFGEATAARFSPEACGRAGLHAQAARDAGRVFEAFLRIAEKENLDTGAADAPEEALRKCLLTAYSDRVARRLSSATTDCEMVHNRRGHLARESAVRKAAYFVSAEVRETEGKGAKTIFALNTAIDPAWLEPLFPEDISTKTDARYDPDSRRVVAEERKRFRDLLLSTRSVDPSPADAARVLAAEVLAGRLQFDGWETGAAPWISRVNFLARACPELGIAPFGDGDRRAVVEELCAGTASWKVARDRDVRSVLDGRLTSAQRAALEKHAPERLELASGRKPKLTYPADGPPYLSARIQDLFGVSSVPRIAMGRVRPLLHILAPNNRPVQITADLPRFWSEHYPKVRSELKRKYPKHEWR